MTHPKLVVGCPIWDRHWAMPAWFASVEANVDKSTTGLVFVVPPSDSKTREVIDAHSDGYRFVEILRDPYEAQDRDVRRNDNFATLAAARNLLLSEVNKVQPDWFLSWDSDFLIEPGVLDEVMSQKKSLTGIWAWLNRQEPHHGRHWDGDQLVSVLWDDPVSCTGMEWVGPQTAEHIDPRRWEIFADGFYRIGAVLAWQLMTPSVYQTCRYSPHPHGEDIPFNWQATQRGFERWMWAESWGLHLYNRSASEKELADGYPTVMRHAQQVPLAAQMEPPANELLSLIGYYPAE